MAHPRKALPLQKQSAMLPRAQSTRRILCQSRSSRRLTRAAAATGSTPATAAVEDDDAHLAAALGGLSAATAAAAAVQLLAPAEVLRTCYGVCALPTSSLETLIRLGGATTIPAAAALACLSSAALRGALATNTHRRLAVGLMTSAAASAVLLVHAPPALALAPAAAAARAALAAAVALACAVAWAANAGRSPTGSMITRGFLANCRAVLRPRSPWSALLGLCSVVGAAVAAAYLLAPCECFHPPSLLCAGALASWLVRGIGANLLAAAPVLYSLKDDEDGGTGGLSSGTVSWLAAAAAATGVAEAAAFAAVGAWDGVVREASFAALVVAWLAQRTLRWQRQQEQSQQ